MSKSIPKSWHSYRRRNWAATATLIIGLPITFLIAIAVNALFGTQSGLLLLGSLLLWAVVWAWSAIRIARWPCPKCGVAWLSNQEVRLGAPRVCSNCGLGLYEEP